MRTPCKCQVSFLRKMLCAFPVYLSYQTCNFIYNTFVSTSLQKCLRLSLFLSPLTDLSLLASLWVQACLLGYSLAGIAVIHSIYQQVCKLTFQWFQNWFIPGKLSNLMYFNAAMALTQISSIHASNQDYFTSFSDVSAMYGHWGVT